MDCRSVIHFLSDYLDGLLAQQEVRHIEAHLQRCQPCHSIKLDLQLIRDAARELPPQEPPRALWARIEREIAAEKPAVAVAAAAPGWWRWLGEKRFTFTLPQLAGASALAASLLTFVALRGIPPAGQQLQPGLAGGKTAVTSYSPAVRAMQERIDERLNRLNLRKASWDPQMKQVFDEHLKRIDSSLASTRQALQANPDPDQQQMLIDLYKEKLQVLEDFDKLK